MRLKNIAGLSSDMIENEVNKGGRFLYFPYTISFIVVTFKRTSGVYFIKANENPFSKSFLFMLISFLFGWWGFPFGPQLTFQSLRTNVNGGKNVTDEVMATIEGHKMFKEVQRNKKS